MYFSEVKAHLIENNIKVLIKSYYHRNYFKYHFLPFCFCLYVLDLKHLKRYRDSSLSSPKKLHVLSAEINVIYLSLHEKSF